MASSKLKTTFFCQSCGAQSAKWVGKCASCGAWNSYVEEIIAKPSSVSTAFLSDKARKPIARKISDINFSEEERIDTLDNELNRVLGGGIMPGSLILLGGEPGIGKSTLLLQMALRMRGKNVYYISGEESDQQISLRAQRLGILNESCFVVTEILLENILQVVSHDKPDILIVDSIQTLYTQLIESSAGSISQIRECAGQLLKLAKTTGIPVWLVGHITKDGNLAGPKMLEHMVDVVLQFEGDRNHLFRILRSSKNRFGSTSEIGIYEMINEGLREVENPSGALLSNKEEGLSGTAVCVTMEGIRPIMLEIQALVSTAAYGTPQRSATGFETRRLNMLLAVLEKRCGFQLGIKDVFLNLTGGIKVEDPAMDLAVVCAILSSNENTELPPWICYAAEVGLTGELRPVTRIEQRIAEAQKLGFKRIYISKFNLKGLQHDKYKIQVVGTGRIDELYHQLFH
ncbi:MAG: DNA repair protein RadA [Candidatus Competibacteraceae bacterium]|nr:DNA repair protein RadA [Candidatus Competibacteraceae bacterium]